MELQLATLQAKANPPAPGLCDLFFQKRLGAPSWRRISKY